MISIPTTTEKKPSEELKASDTFIDPEINNQAPSPDLEQEIFVFSEMEDIAKPLLNSDQAAALDNSDQEEKKLLDEIFNLPQTNK